MHAPALLSRIAKIAAVSLFTLVALAPIGAIAQEDPPDQAGRLSALNGTVSIQAAGTQDWAQAFPNLPLSPGDRIYTDRDGRAEIQLGSTYLRIGPMTDVTLVEASQQNLSFGIAQGSLHVHNQNLWPNQSLYIQTPSGSTIVTQPADFRVDVFPDQQTAVITDNYGPISISGAGDFSAQTSDGQVLQLVGSNPVYSQWLQPAAPDDLDRWSRNRDEQLTRSASRQYVSQEMPGGDDLDANGQWTAESDYGPVWFPNVDPNWAPYRNGHWVNRRPWGWVWIEDESWGYAPFHFGRWVQVNRRWGWVPGPRAAHPVWSPALVVFVGGGDPGVSAWFPLGPGEAYRPPYHCSPRYVDEVNISNIRPAPRVVVQKTYVNVVNVTNVTNVTNITYVNRTTVIAVRQDDFASGRNVSHAAVHVDPQRMAQAKIIAAPQPAPMKPVMIAPPAAKPVPVAVARPLLINQHGQMVSAQPHAQPVAPPVKPVTAPQPLPGRIVIAAPPGAKPQQAPPGAKPPMAQPAQGSKPATGSQPATGTQPATGSQPAAGTQPAHPGAPTSPAGNQPPNHPGTPVTAPGAHPATPGTTPTAPGQPATPAQPHPTPTPAPGTPPQHPANPGPGAPPQRPTTPPPATAQPSQPSPAQPRPNPTPAPATPPQRPATPPPGAPPNHQPPPAQPQHTTPPPPATPNQPPQRAPQQPPPAAQQHPTPPPQQQPNHPQVQPQPKPQPPPPPKKDDKKKPETPPQ